MVSRRSLSTKILLMVEGILLISSILFCSVSIYRSRVGICKAIQQRMLDIANCASGSVNGDVMKGLTEDKIGSDEYNDVYNTLAVFRDNVELEYVYTIREDGNDNFIFTMDLDQVSPASYGDSVEYTDALNSAGNGVAAVDEVPYTDRWGEFYSAYSPVFDSAGKVAGIVAVDFSVGWFEGQLSAQTKSTVAGYIIILVISQIVAALLALLTVRPFVKAQGELLEEKVRAESANNAKSDFLANMSHEIRTPINAVLGMNEMIIREEHKSRDYAEGDTKSMRESLNTIGVYADDVNKAGHNLLALVNDILDYSKIESGHLDIVEASYQLSSLLNDLNHMILFKAQDKKLDFSIDIDETLPDELCGDEVRVRQILTNLLNNAVKYTEKGSVKFTLRGKKQDDGTIFLKAIVKDTGIGIRKEDIDKLFTKFERLEMEVNSTVAGTGLGLTISKRLLDMMGGTITVESEYGKGSVFTVVFPQKILSDTPLGNFQARFETNSLDNKVYREAFRAPDARILIVDDTKINLNVVKNLLRNTKIQIDTTTSGAEAIVMAEKTAYDMILMDQRMPKLTGTEALRRIRNTSGGASREKPVICLTADAVLGAKERYMAEGFTDYLTKPVDSVALEMMLLKYLPESKIEHVEFKPEAETPVESAAKDEYSMLREAGIDPETGLQYCQNDTDFYRSILAEYAQSEAENAELLQIMYAAENWREYSIHVHALKSTSRMIGAVALSELAAKLENAANAEDDVTIRAEHNTLMEKLNGIIRAIGAVAPDVEPIDEESEILEFLPEDEE
ncbi:MAG: response regulator [Clostridiales bacterium]|nr:response regulator [Clostridiales bacterium]